MQAPQIPGIELGVELGRGAHSVVYKARQGGEACAVKLPQTRARWTREIYREAVALARVKHHALPDVLEVGEVEGLPYLVMELIEGKTLADVLSVGALKPAEVLDVAEQLASVLGAVHDVGLVHRDVKPRNIIVADDRSLRLIDFGFTTPMERTGMGDIAGTALYAAPEQLTPPGRVDARSDLYCVGRVLLECLMGPSFALFRTNADNVIDLLDDDTPAPLAGIIRHLLRADPAGRYADAHALAKDLERARAGLPVLGPSAYAHDRGAPATLARTAELDQIVAGIRGTRDGGRLVLLRGARGSGKTRLVDAVERQLRPTTRTVPVGCVADDPPLSTLRRILEACWATTSTDERALTTAELADTFGNLAQIAGLISPRLARELDLPGDVSTPEAVDALSEGAAEILVRVARRLGGLAVLIDDAQWMDHASAAALVRAAHRVGEAPLFLVLAGRPETRRGLLDRFAEVHSSDLPLMELDLAPLAEDGVGRLVASYLATSALDPLVVARIAAMADGTPLGVLEVLGAFLDAGALRPHARDWLFDALKLEAVVLPSGALALLGRRLNDIPTATRRVLEAAAICGTAFHEAQVALVIEVPVSTVEYGTVVGRRAGVIEATEGDGYRFIHDSLRETLLDEMSDANRAELHQRLGELLSDGPTPSFEDLCSAARHLALGMPDRKPARVVRVATAAAAAALERFDDELALDFRKQALAAAAAAGVEPPISLHLTGAEASLRLGAIADSLSAFENALVRTTDVVERARILGRISWAHETSADPARAWDALARAFVAIGERLPIEDVPSAANTALQLAQAQVAKVGRKRRRRSAREVDLLCQLHYQNARLSFEYLKIARLLQSGLVINTLVNEAESRATTARARGVYACVVGALGRREVGLKDAEAALELATHSGDPSAAAFCTQMVAMAASFAGRYDEMIDRFGEVVDTYGPWSEIGEFTLSVYSISLALMLKGCVDETWPWVEKGLARLRRSRTVPPTMVCLVHRARAVLAALDRLPSPESALGVQLAALPPSEPGKGYHRIVAWAPRASYYLESDNLGAEFEQLVRDFAAEGYPTRNLQATLAEFHITVAHARLIQCLRAPAGERKSRVRELAKANASLRGVPAIPVMAAHVPLIGGCLAWLEGDEKKGAKLLAEAETIARRDSVPWVLSALARARAHFLRWQGREAAARDQARVAETLALEHGAIARARIIRTELGLAEPAPPAPPPQPRSSARSTSSRTTRQLAALIHVAKGTRRDGKADELAGGIIDELLRSMNAERGAIWFQPEVPSAGTAVSRQRRIDASVSVGAESPLGALLRAVHARGFSWPGEEAETLPEATGYDPTRMHVVPLHLYEQPVGALAIERDTKGAPFTSEDRQLLELLAHQVPITLEIARLLREREQLHASLQQAQKMEAIGQLAGGIAHDFNNMLAAMKVALSAAQERAYDDRELSDELDIIAQATTRASQLTSQLLSFARHKPLPTCVQDINQLVVKLEPMLRRVATDGIEVILKLSPAVEMVELDPGSFDQVLMNLLINARDAMPRGGKFTIASRNVTLEGNSAVRAHVSPGQYVEIEVTDTGEGMSSEIVARIFEPFFTTKPVGRGTGLGLATVYGFAKNCGGGIEVQSEIGTGTQFRLYLKRVERPRPARSSFPKPASASSSSHGPAVPDTILVIDDDDLVRRSIAKILERHGYRVISANGGAEAMDVARTQGKRIGLVILDVLLPGVTGPELGRRLVALDIAAKLLFVSGFSAESAPIEDANISAEMLLQKPFSQSALLERVKQLMPSATASTQPSSN